MNQIPSPDDIRHLPANGCFVYGSNRAGIHGAGAARHAMIHFGAVMGKDGFQGKSFGIATKDEDIKTLPLDDIRDEVDYFLDFAREHPETLFLVTAIGTGLAGYSPKDIAPMFDGAPDNVRLPQSFLEIINQK